MDLMHHNTEPLCFRHPYPKMSVGGNLQLPMEIVDALSLSDGDYVAVNYNRGDPLGTHVLSLTKAPRPAPILSQSSSEEINTILGAKPKKPTAYRVYAIRYVRENNTALVFIRGFLHHFQIIEPRRGERLKWQRTRSGKTVKIVLYP